MINRDLIQISCGSGHRWLGVGPSGGLQAVGRAEDFLFGDFVDGFAVRTSGSDSEAMIVKADDSEGEPWELRSAGRVFVPGDE